MNQNHTNQPINMHKKISEEDIESVLEKVREFQEVNKKYLIKTANLIVNPKPTIISTTTTNY